MMLQRFLITMTLLCLSSCARAAIVQIPFRWTPGQIEIEVSVNGRDPVWFILDTGAEYSIVDAQLADALGLKREQRGAREFAHGVDFRIGSIELRKQDVMIFQLDNFRRQKRDIVGLIGYDFFAKRIVQIDYDRKIVTVSDRALTEGTVVPLTRVGRQVAVPLTIDAAGKSIRAMVTIDTGAQAPLILRYPYASRHGLVDAATARKESDSVAGGRLQFLQLPATKITFAGSTFDDVTLGIYAKPTGAGGSTDSDGLLGNEILRRFVVTLDYARGRMILSRSRPVSTGSAAGGATRESTRRRR